MQKNHQECDNEIITGFMPQLLNPDGTVHKLCPVRAFENYIIKLHPDNHSLWLKPLHKIPKDASSPWYEKTTVGHNTHEKFLSILSDKAKLSQKYTNHCIRVTGVTNLTRANFSAKQVMSITGHKSVESLSIYQRVKEDEKLMMGMCLTYSLFNPQKAKMIENNIEMPQNAEVPAIITPQQDLNQVPPIQKLPALPLPPPQQKDLVPLENAIVPYQPPPKLSDSPNFDLMALIAEAEKEELSDQELLMAATQCESVVTPEINNTMKATALMKKKPTTTSHI